ncbi:proline-rich protein 14 isoform X2 [Microcaecilia unicolor]|uniref:Proline-rich protein 14 isoform X2 n=1 Tax=Microcaecilia unicolor TaxID=1415580 RepID=A0A6P7YMR5_9AMPH|nr:proline-rich protein 14 isoform X2 [Microcaecilia unicolor]
MDCCPAELKLEKGLHLSPTSTLTPRAQRRHRQIIYRPSTEDQEGPVLDPQFPRKQDKPSTTPQSTAGRREAFRTIPSGPPGEKLEEGDVAGRKRRKRSKSNCLVSGDSVGSWQQKRRRWRKELPTEASPVERTRHRVLAVVLQDLAGEEPEEEKVEDSAYLESTEESSSGNQLTLRSQSEETEYWRPVAKLPCRELTEVNQESSNNERATPELRLLTPPVGDSSPQETGSKCYQGWRIGPLFHSMRCKLETFAEILLTPVKNKWALSDPTSDPTHSDSPLPTASGATSSPLREANLYTEGEGTAVLHEEVIVQDPLPGAQVSPGQPGMNIEVKIAISEPQASSSSLSSSSSIQDFKILHSRMRRREGGEVSCRPPIHQWRSQSSWQEWSSADNEQEPTGDPRPLLFQPRLGRSYSCPNFPSVASSPTSFLIAGSLRPQPGRQRRHTICSVEVSRELGYNTFTLPCLKKEIFPFSTGGTPPVMSLPHSEPSPVEPSLEHVQSRISSLHQVTPHRGSRTWGSFDHRQPGPSNSESLTKEGQLSLQILEESSLSDSEIKNMDSSQSGSKGKVSRFRIRKRPAKQQSNLTPMGLPKPVSGNSSCKNEKKFQRTCGLAVDVHLSGQSYDNIAKFSLQIEKVEDTVNGHSAKIIPTANWKNHP